MNIQIDKNSRVPIYDQIKEQITGLIQAGQIKAGYQLPTIRKLSMELSVNVNTVALAYRDLANHGVIITARGKGSFVAGTPSEGEMQSLRQEKIKNMIAALVKETDRLGYTDEEVGRAFVDQFRKRNM
jgi:DNA-binding transcriptional regulator YhcF (GntR family)